MGDQGLFGTPPPTHVIYIPFVMLLGYILGFVMGRRGGIKQGRAEYLGTGETEDV